MTSENQALAEKAKTLAAQASRAPTIEDEETAGKVAELERWCQGFLKKAEDERKEKVKPLNDEVKRINGGYKELKAPVETAKARLNQLQTEWMRKQQALAQERARLAREKAEAEAVEQASALEKLGHGEDAERIVDDTVKAGAIATATTRTGAVRGDYGATASLQRKWTFKIFNKSEVPEAYKVVNESALRQFIGEVRSEATVAAERHGLKGKEKEARIYELMNVNLTLPGVEFYTEESARVR